MSSPQEKTGRGIPSAETVRCLDLVSYQEGAIVSRVLLGRDAGNVTLFAFDADQGLSEHTAPFDALVYLLEGEAEIVISGKAFRATAGEMVLLPAHQPHALKAVTAFKMLLIMIRSGAAQAPKHASV